MKGALLLGLVFLALAPLSARAGETGPSDGAAAAERLYQQGRWQAIVAAFPGSPSLSAELDYYRGMALAKLGRWREARAALLEGRRKDPRDKRFPLELAGIAFKQKNFAEAKRNLHRAVRLDPDDAYAREFLASIYFLDNNLDAALESWNRLGEPRIRDVTVDPPLHLDPEFLDRTFVFSPASVLRLKDLRATRARLGQLGIFPAYRFTLAPSAGDGSDSFDLRFSAAERNGWGDGKWEGLLGLLRGLPYQTVYPEFYNLRDSSINLTSLFRWDDQKRRAEVSLSAPLHRNPQWRYRIDVDASDENWDLSRTFHQAGPPLQDLNLRKAEAASEIQSVVSGRWTWATGVALARRTFRNFSAPGRPSNLAFAGGTSLEYRLRTDYLLLDRPEKRFTLDSSAAAQLGKIFGRSPGKFSRLEASLTGRWFPRAQGDDFEFFEQGRLGGASGDLPLDELFMLGFERDNDLPLRAHIGTLGGRKGNAPLGRDYFLSNWEINKNIYSNGWIKVRLAPFLDTGRITDGSGPFGAPGWLWDTGGEVKVQVLGGTTVVLAYGKDLRTGRNTFYTWVRR